MPDDWYANYNNVVKLARYLEELGEFPNTSELIYFFEKPWKWTDKWNSYLESQYKKEQSQLADNKEVI